MAPSPPTEELQPTPRLSVVNDVWYMIVDILTQPPSPKDIVDEEEGEEEGEREGLDGWRPKSLAKLFPNLHDLISLSSTSTWFRNLLAPRIFATLYLRNTTKSALSIKSIANGSFSGCVKELRYVGICEPDQRMLPLEEVYPPEVDNVLSSLVRFKGLEKLSIEFPFDYEELYDYFQDDFNESLEAAATEERRNAWHGLMAASFRAIVSGYRSQCHPGDLVPRSLSIHDLNIVALSVFSMDEFHNALSRLKNFDMSLKRWDNGVGWMLNTQSIFQGLPDYLGPWFFHHLSSVEEFSFDPRDSASLGNAGQAYCDDIGLRNASMPMLRKLTLTNIIICFELRDFLIRHLDTLESILLQHCYAYKARQGEGWLSWSEIFSALAQESPSRLTSFQLSCADQDELLYLEDNYADPNLVEQVRWKLEVEPDVRVFPYCDVSDKYGARYHDSEANQTAFLQGNDDRSYRNLMAIVDSNARGPADKLNRDRFAL
ncbi:hypothetical protein ETB97_011416 [Aspergillus alliaceus]|uniref:F-box domain-containing protein n=1 Tax=Petromyces alliaceus TaxID=209559 RepID=A0A8H6ADD8_PETAA|nr:hypothetical protein ETB97_011416 [Aspergillus burnettii]